MPLTFKRAESGPLLDEVFRLRYEVYCKEKGFLSAKRYPDRMESDEFDEHALHFVALLPNGEVIGTARVIPHSARGFPLDRYFAETDIVAFSYLPRCRMGEISRLAVRSPRRVNGAARGEAPYRRSDIALGLYREIYQASRTVGLTHLLAAMERSLDRLLSRFSFPFEAVGPEIDYYGPVRPYLLDIAAAEQLLMRRCPRALALLADGLPKDSKPSVVVDSGTIVLPMAATVGTRSLAAAYGAA